MDAVTWLIAGVLAGAVARLLLPGRDPLGLLGVVILGVIGSVVGGLVVNLITGGRHEPTPAALVGAVLGGIATLVAYRVTITRPTA